MDKRTTDDWVALVQKGKSGWALFYKQMLGSPVSDIDKFMKAVDSFGQNIMLEAVFAASTRKLTGDPLNYVFGIALSKVNDRITDASEDAKYQMQMDRLRQRTALMNEELEAKLERARKINGIE